MKKYYYKSLLTGFYGVCAKRGFSDGFLNKCRKDAIPLRNVRGKGKSEIYFFVPCEFFDAVRENAALSGMETEVSGVFGFIPFILKNKHRVFAFIGIALTLLFLAFMSSRVWSISVSGNEKVFTSEILRSCDEEGLKTGAKKKEIDVIALQNKLIEKDGRLLWVSVNIEGMCAQIQVRETVKAEDDVIGKPCNYVADFDGIIKICRVYSGVREVMCGSGVHKGDLLISGIKEYETGETAFFEARGKITAQHQVKVRQKQSESQSMRSYSSGDVRYSLYVFGSELKLFREEKQKCEITKEISRLEINGVIMPIYICKYRVTQYEEKEVSDEKLMRLTALNACLSSVRDTFKNSRVVSHTAKYKNGFEADFDVIDYIGKKSVILLENE